MNIGVIGAGKLGLSFALLCAHKGYAVTASDKNPDYIDRLQKKTHTTTEPFIDAYLKEDNDIIFTTSNKLVVDSSDVIFLFVPTPSLYTGEYDHQYIEQAIESIQECDLTDKILVIGCTTMPGYTQSLTDRTGYTIVYNPEFIAQGSIIDGLKNADMVLMGGTTDICYNILGRVYSTIMDREVNLNVMSPTAAEITKISINCFLTMKIAYANMIGEIAINTGIENEVSTVLSAIGSDSRIGNKYLKYGFGYGGPCLPRDMRALGIHSEKVGIDGSLCSTVDEMNNIHHYYLVDYYTKQNPDKRVPFIFWQLSYKKGVDMIVESQQYRLAKALEAIGYKVYTTDTIQTDIPYSTETAGYYI